MTNKLRCISPGFRIPFLLHVLLIVGLLASAKGTRSLHAAEEDWRVGMARVKITPPYPVWMSGYASRDKPFQSVEADLYAKALALIDKEGNRAILITSDLIGFPADVAEPICERISQKTGLKRSRILLSSSHTHTGPGTTTKTQSEGDLPTEDAKRLYDFTGWLQDRVVELAIEAFEKEPTPARLSRGTGVVNFVMNRREPTANGVILGFNPRGPADRSVPVLRIESLDGELLGVVFQAAAHNTTLGSKHFFICGDYAGFSQEYVERKFPGVQAMFMLGCAGDANPHPRGTLEDSRAHGDELGAEVCRVLETKLTSVKGALKTEFTQVALPLQPILSEKEIQSYISQSGGWRKWVGGKMLEIHNSGEPAPAHYSAPLALWQFGDDLTLVAMSGEVVVDYVYLMEKTLGPLNLWVSAYCNDVYGYLPSARVLREGGYETRGLYRGGIGIFTPEVENVMAAAAKKLAEKAGRGLPIE